MPLSIVQVFSVKNPDITLNTVFPKTTVMTDEMMRVQTKA